ncbi:MAG TPA: acyl-CoA dehydrogenase family protein [Acidimicrobiales bacterium]|nr:acyl-CoA dehydrogenase family protein [Acidimicrobiales bacterium]
MDFSLDPDEQLLVDTARSILRDHCPPSLVRAHIEDPSVADGLWKQLSGFAALGGESLVELCLFLHQTGAALAPGPFFATTALFVPLLAAAQADQELRARALSGEVTGTVALADRRGDWVAHDDPVKWFVPEAARVDYVAVVGLPGPTVSVHSSPRCRQTPSLDWSRLLYEVDPAGSEPAFGPYPLAEDLLEQVLERATVALSAEMLGTTSWMFDTTLAYAKARHQFGRPIGSFQAIKHKLANMALVKDQAEAAVYYAAMAADAGDPDRHRASHVAKVMAGKAARLNLKDAIQIHGGIGYTYDYDLHLYMRRALASETLLGTSDWHRDRLAEDFLAG